MPVLVCVLYRFKRPSRWRKTRQVSSIMLRVILKIIIIFWIFSILFYAWGKEVLKRQENSIRIEFDYNVLYKKSTPRTCHLSYVFQSPSDQIFSFFFLSFSSFLLFLYWTQGSIYWLRYLVFMLWICFFFFYRTVFTVHNKISCKYFSRKRSFCYSWLLNGRRRYLTLKSCLFHRGLFWFF